VWEVQLLKWLKRLADSSILFMAFWKEEQNLICNLCQNLYRCFTKKNDPTWSFGHAYTTYCWNLLCSGDSCWGFLLVHLFPVRRYAAILDPPVRVPFCHNPPTLKNEKKIYIYIYIFFFHLINMFSYLAIVVQLFLLQLLHKFFWIANSSLVISSSF
jgi:hypothetical protein